MLLHPAEKLDEALLLRRRERRERLGRRGVDDGQHAVDDLVRGLHDWDDPSAGRLLANIATAAPSGARVRAFELVVPPGGAPHMATMIDLTMLGMLTGRERDEQEMRELVEGAGLRFEGVRQTQTPISSWRRGFPDGALWPRAWSLRR